MQLLRHDPDGPHKLVRVETTGCAVNVLIDLHEETGTPVIAVEVEPAIPDEHGRVWEAKGPTAVVVRCLGRQDEPITAVETDLDETLATLHRLAVTPDDPTEAVGP